MRNNFKRLLAAVLTIAMFAGFAIPASAATTVSNVGSLWDGFTSGSGTFTVTETSRVFVVGDSEPTGTKLQTVQLIQRELKAQFGYAMDLVWGPASYAKTGDIVLNLDASSGTGTEGYKLDVNATTATVTAADVDGLIYGANNLIKCFRAVGGNSISGFSGADAPDTVERTVSLDCGRKYLSAEWIKNFIRQMSWMGYNTIELHFSDDGGYRLDIWDSAYYTDGFRPTNDFSWLCGSHVQSWVKNGNANNDNYDYQTDPDAGKYLKTSEIVDILKVAKEYHIDVIPAFDSPAHMDYITWKFEQNYKSNTSYSFTYGGKTWCASSTSGCINYTGRTGGATPLWPYYTTVDITSGTMGEAFVLAMYEDIADFFKVYAGSTDFSIGADEVQLNTSNLASGYSYKWDYSKFVSYIKKLNGILNGKRYTMRMFNDFLGSTSYNYSSTTSTSNIHDFDTNIEIMYWDSPFDQNSGNNGTATVKASVLANEGFNLYNCIQSNCYYVLRVANSSTVSKTYKYMDARNPDNLNWSFNYSTEEKIYTTWTPNDMGEKGKYSTTDTVSSIAGAYFLIWNDYASVSTESELWNGAPDNTGTNNGVTYYLLDRMASNIIKMWNWDVDDSVSYSNFKSVRETFGNFPGYTSCSAAASLPAASSATQAYLADHSALEAALETKVSNTDGTYTAESYAAYETAYAAAETVNANYGATADEIQTAITNLENAKDALTEVSTDNGGDEDTGDDVVVELDPAYAQARLNYLTANAYTRLDVYTEDSWNAYQAAIESAKDTSGNADISAQIKAVESAMSGLVATSDNTEIIQIVKLTKTVRQGKQVGLKVITTPDVAELTIDDVSNLTVCTGKVQTLNTGDTVKIWLVYFPASTAGEIEYTIHAGTEIQTVSVTIK
ncbi:MAG: family 20 glycosylhydrolase [Oscillospiraceae bacterium]|nr:family 20 glycosylhydrolase [Oscillospiraceae bacterium]